MDEALALSDRIVIMDKGEVIQFDTPENILTKPANEFVSHLLGEERIRQAKFDYQTIDKIMIKDPISIGKNVTLKNAAQTMKDKRVDTLFIVNEEKKITWFSQYL